MTWFTSATISQAQSCARAGSIRTVGDAAASLEATSGRSATVSVGPGSVISPVYTERRPRGRPPQVADSANLGYSAPRVQRSTILCVLSGHDAHARAIASSLAEQLGRHVVELDACASPPQHLARIARRCQESRPLALVTATTDHIGQFAAWLWGIPVLLSWSEAGSSAQLVDVLDERARRASSQSGLPLLVKRAIDVSISASALVVSAPLLALSALAIQATLGSPVFFRQERPGKDGRLFRIYKLRTMTTERGPDGRLLPDEQRLVGLGKWLRRASVDELPQLLNVLRGQMSLVGPRPLLPQYLSRYSARQARRQNVLPGITGLAQVNGRNAMSWSERLERDVEYVDNWSLALDAAIVWKTLGTVFSGSGVSQDGHATMPEFQGDSAS